MKFDVYNGNDTLRFVLGKTGSNPLAIFGINPSKADQCSSDTTINRVEELIKVWPFDGFLMFNLYPLRNSKPSELSQNFDQALAAQNMATIRVALKKYRVKCAWAAWGDAFEKRSYFKNYLGEILSGTADLGLEWKRCETLTKKFKNPRHPLSGRPHIITRKSQLADFDIENYLRLGKKFNRSNFGKSSAGSL